MVSHCARPTRVYRDRALREHFQTLYIPLGEWPRLPFSARMGRAHSYCARSASKKGTWPPLPIPPSLFTLPLWEWHS
jgi:hypothetical protein